MKYRFVHIPKTGGVSLDKLVYSNPSCNIQYLQHVLVSDITRLFTFVRNPYARIVSAYFYLGSNTENETMVAYKHIILKYPSFKDFVLNMEKDGLLEFIIHLKPMYTWVCDEKGRVIPEVFKIEEPEQINEFLISNGLEGWVDSPKVNTSEHQPYETYLDKEVIDEINRIYKLDFELFNYKIL